MTPDWLERRKASGFDWQPTIDALAKLVIRSDDEDEQPFLIVDASALAGEFSPHVWWLLPADEGDEWSHGPSGTSGPLFEMLVSITETYTRRALDGEG